MREHWWVTNVTQKPLTIGDLPKVPTLVPGKVEDVLAHVSREEASESTDLASMLGNGWLTLSKAKDGNYPLLD